MSVLGFDTSNYTTSVALYGKDGYELKRRLLYVEKGARGLRQNDALFLHTKNIPDLMDELNIRGKIEAVAVSDRPRDAEGSYMPCFLAGVSAAETAAKVLGVPLYRFSHQSGHIMAAVVSCESLDFSGREFYCYHLSGGTTELVKATPDDERGFKAEIIGGTTDISAGQLIDRAGVLMGLNFPCGGELEKLAINGRSRKVRVSVDGEKCNYSGAENTVIKMLESGESKEDVSRYVLDYCSESIIQTVNNAMNKFGQRDVLYVGGVMRNEYIRNKIKEKTQGAHFGSAELSSDNAVGIAALGYFRLKGKKDNG
ncbi:MAG: hypothetical protein K6F14_01795 [Clostridiales bacterium]|nr:hypothetical protein [Clostridiales bacterium]